MKTVRRRRGPGAKANAPNLHASSREEHTRMPSEGLVLLDEEGSFNGERLEGIGEFLSIIAMQTTYRILLLCLSDGTPNGNVRWTEAKANKVNDVDGVRHDSVWGEGRQKGRGGGYSCHFFGQGLLLIHKAANPDCIAYGRKKSVGAFSAATCDPVARKSMREQSWTVFTEACKREERAAIRVRSVLEHPLSRHHSKAPDKI